MDMLPAAGLGERRQHWVGGGTEAAVGSSPRSVQLLWTRGRDWDSGLGRTRDVRPVTWPPWPGPKPEVGPLVPTRGLLRLSDSGTSFLG